MTDPRLYPSEIDPRHYVFVRESGLPRDYFRRWRLTADQCVFAACVIGGAVALIWGW